MNTTYLRYETLRLFRNRQNFIFSLIFPVVLYFFIAGNNRSAKVNSLPFPTYYMAGMIAFERDAGWTRQLRISPLSVRSYLATKVAGAYLFACLTIALLFAAGIVLGVRMPFLRWVELVVLILIGLIPFAALGVMLGHLIKGDTMGPIMGGGLSLLSILGGAFAPLGSGHSILVQISQLTPTYWIVQAGHTAAGGQAWGVRGWVTVAIWSVLLIRGAVWAYRRDTGRP